jgi:hypothetical protein
MSKILRFAFEGPQDQGVVEADMALAIFAAECIHGRPRVRMETRYLLSPDGKSCAMELAGDAGEAAARVFAGLVSARLGEEGVSISHCQGQGNSRKRPKSQTTPQQVRS